METDGRDLWDTDSARLADTGMAFNAEAPDDIAATQDEMTGQSGDITIQGRPTSTQEEAPVDGLSLVRQSLLNTGLLEESIDIVLASWKDTTKRKHLMCVHKWIIFCTHNHINVFTKDVSHIFEIFKCVI